MDKSELKQLADAANAKYTDPDRNRIVNEAPGEPPRFEVYHFFLSMCSYKVRAVLDEKGASYISHDIDILPPNMHNYFPEYVRLRVRGGEATGRPLVNGYTGRSATETEGFDPCVVPTVVDWETCAILVDSKAICLHLDSAIPGGTQLVPKDIESEVIAQMDIVDRTPHVALLYGANPEGDGRPGFIQEGMKTVHDAKIGKLRENMATVPGDPALVAAYEHKIVKEQKAKAFVRSESDMRAGARRVQGAPRRSRDSARGDGRRVALRRPVHDGRCVLGREPFPHQVARARLHLGDGRRRASAARRGVRPAPVRPAEHPSLDDPLAQRAAFAACDGVLRRRGRIARGPFPSPHAGVVAGIVWAGR